MGSVAPHKIWSAAKEQASRLYAQSQSSKQYLDEAMGGESQTYPLSFKSGLGPLLEQCAAANQKLAAENKKADKTGELQAALNAEENLKKLLGKAALVVKDYTGQVKKKAKELDEKDPRIAKLLLGALGLVTEKLVTLKPNNSMNVSNLANDLAKQHKEWSAAKKNSESAYKNLLKDKDLAEPLKKAKLNSYPCKFKAALGPSLDKAAKAIMKMDTSTAKKALDDVKSAAEDYQKEIKTARGAFTKAKITGKQVDTIFDEMDETLEWILS